MKRNSQPHNLTAPEYSWKKYFGRLRMGWITLREWKLCGCYTWSWFFVFRNYNHHPYHHDAKYFQFTILGLQIAYLYSGEVPK